MSQQTEQIGELLLRLTLLLEDCGYTVPIMCANCSEELLLICPECDHYDGDPEEGCLPAAKHIACCQCSREIDRSHDNSCKLYTLLHEAKIVIRDLEEAL
jgi:hypothetical protein